MLSLFLSALAAFRPITCMQQQQDPLTTSTASKAAGNSHPQQPYSAICRAEQKRMLGGRTLSRETMNRIIQQEGISLHT